MLAGLARIFGVFMGGRIDPANHEDLDLQLLDFRRLSEMIQARNAEHDLWGWKDPGLFLTLRDCYKSLRNPYFVVSFRDVLASSQTQVNGGFLPEMIASLRLTYNHLGHVIDFVEVAAKSGLPLLLSSYERAIGRKDILVEELANFLGIELDEATRQRAICFIDPERGYSPRDGSSLVQRVAVESPRGRGSRDAES